MVNLLSPISWTTFNPESQTHTLQHPQPLQPQGQLSGNAAKLKQISQEGYVQFRNLPGSWGRGLMWVVKGMLRAWRLMVRVPSLAFTESLNHVRKLPGTVQTKKL